MAAPLAERLGPVLAEVLVIDAEADGALTVRHDGTLASLRVVSIAEDLELVSLTQILAWDLPLTHKLRDRVIEQAAGALLGTVTLVAKAPGDTATAAAGTAGKRNSGKRADVLLRYNFPAAGLTDDALRTLVLLVLEKGIDIRRVLTR